MKKKDISQVQRLEKHLQWSEIKQKWHAVRGQTKLCPDSGPHEEEYELALCGWHIAISLRSYSRMNSMLVQKMNKLPPKCTLETWFRRVVGLDTSSSHLHQWINRFLNHALDYCNKTCQYCQPLLRDCLENHNKKAILFRE